MLSWSIVCTIFFDHDIQERPDLAELIIFINPLVIDDVKELVHEDEIEGTHYIQAKGTRILVRFIPMRSHFRKFDKIHMNYDP